ncbi:MAG: DNA-binding protein WhiA, partial [Clostridia bacterium]
EEIRVFREMKNNVNRLVNCETANLNKTISASVKQIETIKRLKKSGKFNNLPEDLKEIANLRLENPDATLEQLGNMLKNPIGKSSVSHRFKKLEDH